MMSTIYLDNAAGSFPKAPGLGQSMADFIETGGGNISRSSYRLSTGAASGVLALREALGALFGCPDSHIIFTSGVTQSLNMVMKGVLKPGDHLIVSAMEHNAVLRPAAQLAQQGVSVSVAPCDGEGNLLLEEFRRLLRPETRMAVISHASNVSGTILDPAAAGLLCRERGIFLAVDAAQTAGLLAVDLNTLHADAVCFAGHKGLLGPQGIGGIALTKTLSEAMTPLLAGGTGSFSSSDQMPDQLPDRFEAGTLNLPGIIGLGHALAFLNASGIAALRAREIALTERLLRAIAGHPRLRIPGPACAERRMGIVSVDFPARDNGEIAYLLERDYGILVRCGLHCAPLAHKALNTFPQGTVRFSVGWATTERDVDAAASAILSLAEKKGAEHSL